MGKKKQKQSPRVGSGSGRRISIRAVRRDPADAKKTAEALIALVVAQAEADARAEHERSNTDAKRRSA